MISVVLENPLLLSGNDRVLQYGFEPRVSLNFDQRDSQDSAE